MDGKRLFEEEPQKFWRREFMGLGSGLPILLRPVPMMDCPNCMYHQEQWRDGGHCYMFRDKPEGDRCGQFTATQTTK